MDEKKKEIEKFIKEAYKEELELLLSHMDVRDSLSVLKDLILRKSIFAESKQL